MNDKNEMHKKIQFRKNTPEINYSEMKDYCPIIPNLGPQDNLFSTRIEMATFLGVLSDLGIDGIVYRQEGNTPLTVDYHYEIRMTVIHTLSMILMHESETHPIREEIIEEVFLGLQNIFSRQANPESLYGINLAKRIEEIEESGSAFVTSYFQARKGLFPETDPGRLEDLTQYRKGVEFPPDVGIGHFQFRLFYDDPQAQVNDLISAFDFINKRLDKPFEFIVGSD